MRTSEDVSGITVIAIDSGTKIGKVEDLIFDFQENRLLGILFKDSETAHEGRLVPYAKIRGIGPDAVMIDGEGALIAAGQDAAIDDVLGRQIEIKGKEMYTTDGKDLGRVVDIQFDEKTGRIEGYEVSEGIFADAYSGRSFIPAPKSIKIGRDVCLVPPDVAEAVEKRAGGLRRASQRLSERVQQAGLAAADKAQEIGRQALDKAQELGDAFHQRSTDTDAALPEAKGKTATRRDVLADDGTQEE